MLNIFWTLSTYREPHSDGIQWRCLADKNLSHLRSVPVMRCLWVRCSAIQTKSFLSPVGAGGDDAYGCGFPPWGHRRGVLALHFLSFWFGDLSGKNPRSKVWIGAMEASPVSPLCWEFRVWRHKFFLQSSGARHCPRLIFKGVIYARHG
jgi:hypothetical protein